MSWKTWVVVFSVALLPLTARAGEPRPDVGSAEARIWFERALGLDLGQAGKPDAIQAFDGMRRAAESGDPQAAFNVAIMLDSGRGAARNVEEAAIWYARAAARGVRRGAFNLGQLYETGEGVPANADLSRAWYAASDLPAARGRLAGLALKSGRPAHVVAPVPLFPVANRSPQGDDKQIDLVWTSSIQPASVRYFVELRGLDAGSSKEAWSGFVDVSSVRLPLPEGFSTLAWRVSAVAKDPGDYAMSGWSIFSVPQAVMSADSSGLSPRESFDLKVELPQVANLDPGEAAESPAANKQQPYDRESQPSATSIAPPETKSANREPEVAPQSERPGKGAPEISPGSKAEGEVAPSGERASKGDGSQLLTPNPDPSSPTSPVAPTILIILAQRSVTMPSDLSNKAVVIAGVSSISRSDVEAALSEAGARTVQLTEGTKGDIDRLVDGDVSAAIVARVSPTKAQSFPEIAGFRLLRVAVTHAAKN